MSVHATLPNPHSIHKPASGTPRNTRKQGLREIACSTALLLYLWDHRSEEISEYAICKPKHWSGERTLILAPIPQSGYRSPVFDKSSRNTTMTKGKKKPSRITVPLGSYNLQLSSRQQRKRGALGGRSSVSFFRGTL